MVAVLILLAGSAWARPWPRGAGAHFLSFSSVIEAGQTVPGGSLYFEKGMSDRTTLILSGNLSRGGDPQGFLSLSRNLWPGRDWRFGWSLGAGVTAGAAATRAELSVGRGLSVLGHPGWFLAEARTVATRQQIDGTLEATLGLTLPQGSKVFSQLSASARLFAFGPPPSPPEPEVRAALSAALPVRQGIWVELGLSVALRGNGATRLKLGVWREF